MIVARIRGTATAALIRECQNRVLGLQRETSCDRIMYDALELERPAIDIVLTQQALTDELNGGKVDTLLILGGNPVFSATAVISRSRTLISTRWPTKSGSNE